MVEALLKQQAVERLPKQNTVQCCQSKTGGGKAAKAKYGGGAAKAAGGGKAAKAGGAEYHISGSPDSVTHTLISVALQGVYIQICNLIALPD